MKSEPLIIGTRGSDLALAQAKAVQKLLAEKCTDREVVLKIISTTGDQRLDVSLTTAANTMSGGAKLDKGLFTKEIELALIAREIDLAVHSLKDVPTTQPNGLAIVAVLEREDTADVLLSKQSMELESCGRKTIATSSLRRKLQMLEVNPQLEVVDIRGNVPTRIQKLIDSETLDGTILAQAGLNRLGIDVAEMGLHTISLAKQLLPAPGQGAIGLECREADSETLKLLQAINHLDTWAEVTAERSLLKALGGGCQMPLGVSTQIDCDGLTLEAQLFRKPGERPVTTRISGNKADAEALGIKAMEQLNEKD